MKKLGAVVAVVGLILWFGGEFIGLQGSIGLAVFIIGVALYNFGRKKDKVKEQGK